MKVSARIFRKDRTRLGSLAGALLLAACGVPGGGGGGTGGGSPGSGGVGTGGAASGSGGASMGTGGAASGSGGASTGTGGATSGSGGAGASIGTGGSGSGTGGAGSGTGGRSAGGGAPAGGAGGMSMGNGGAGGRAGAGSGGRIGTGGTSGGGAAGGATGAGGATPSAGCGITDWLKSGTINIDVSGTTRQYILKIPDGYDTNKAYKLVFGWHARGGNASQVAPGYYGLESRSAGTAIFVAPEGIDAGFANTNGRDSAFVKAMLASFNAKLCIDQQRIFSTGFSYGGMMSDSIGCEFADIFRAIAPMSGAITNPNHQYSGCNKANDHPIAVWMSHGDGDTVVPLADGMDALNLFIMRNKCQSQTTAVTPSPCVAYQGCTAGYPIHYCQFSGGHAVPSFAAAAIWTFFSQF